LPREAHDAIWQAVHELRRPPADQRHPTTLADDPLVCHCWDGRTFYTDPLPGGRPLTRSDLTRAIGIADAMESMLNFRLRVEPSTWHHRAWESGRYEQISALLSLAVTAWGTDGPDAVLDALATHQILTAIRT
jgi:hypothetical protein